MNLDSSGFMRPGFIRPKLMRYGLAATCAIVPMVVPGFAHAQGAARTAVRPATLTQALAEAYANNPTLQQQRANLRATDENVPAALSGWRPTVTLSGTAGRIVGNEEFGSSSAGAPLTGRPQAINPFRSETRNEAIGQVTVTQPVFEGGKTVASTHEAKNNVYSARASLLATEQSVFINVVQAYVTDITDRHLLALDINNEKVLAQQRRSVRAQFNVGAVTQTSVAQANASYSQAREQVEVAEGNLHIADENFRQYVGSYPARHLVPPQPLNLPARTKAAAARAALMNNPNVIAALFTEAADHDAVDVAFATLAPQLSLQISAYDESNPIGPRSRSEGGQALANLTIPLFQGGSEYAAIRQARDRLQSAYAGVILARRAAVKQATQAWEGLASARAAIRTSHEVIKSDALALEGTEREELVGTRDTLDVLNAQQALLNAQTQLVQNIANVISNSYAVAEAIGRLTATDLALPVTHYDDLKYYRAVKDALFGTGNNAYAAAGIAPNGTLLAKPRLPAIRVVPAPAPVPAPVPPSSR